jgi:hypothetical protein
MTWIKDNKFLAALIGGTLVAVVLLYLLGSKGSARYDLAKENFDAAAAEASTFESLPLYPRTENRDGKNKALDEYRQAATALQAAFEPYRPKDIVNVSPQDFTNRLKADNDEVRKALEDAGAVVPEPFFSGFESYKTTLARGNATGILGYQLGAIKELLLALAQTRPSALKNLHRPPLAEEQGGAYQPKSGEVARPLPLEISFTGPEKSLREFLSAVTKPGGKHYFVVRSLRVTNSKKEPPRAADAKFEAAATAAPTATPAAELFSGFVMPGEEAKPAEQPAATPAPAPAAGTGARILSQVLGNEEVQVFLRLDLMQFLPAQPLP